MNHELHEQLNSYYHQISMITETLQKELKTKEELAAELQYAYEKMRKASLYTPTTPGTVPDIGNISRSSSNQTIDGPTTPGRAQGRMLPSKEPTGRPPTTSSLGGYCGSAGA